MHNETIIYFVFIFFFFLFFGQEETVDVLVKWKNGGEKNVVSIRDLIYQERLRKGAEVTMLLEGVSWEGNVLALEDSEIDFYQDVIIIIIIIINCFLYSAISN